MNTGVVSTGAVPAQLTHGPVLAGLTVDRALGARLLRRAATTPPPRGRRGAAPTVPSYVRSGDIGVLRFLFSALPDRP